MRRTFYKILFIYNQTAQVNEPLMVHTRPTMRMMEVTFHNCLLHWNNNLVKQKQRTGTRVVRTKLQLFTNFLETDQYNGCYSFSFTFQQKIGSPLSENMHLRL